MNIHLLMIMSLHFEVVVGFPELEFFFYPNVGFRSFFFRFPNERAVFLICNSQVEKNSISFGANTLVRYDAEKLTSLTTLSLYRPELTVLWILLPAKRGST